MTDETTAPGSPIILPKNPGIILKNIALGALTVIVSMVTMYSLNLALRASSYGHCHYRSTEIGPLSFNSLACEDVKFKEGLQSYLRQDYLDVAYLANYYFTGNILRNPDMSDRRAMSNGYYVVYWTHAGWGENKRLENNYAIGVNGWTDNFALGLVITEYKSGDAKLYQEFEPEENATYTYSDFYKSDVVSYGVLAVCDTSISYANDRCMYKDIFTSTPSSKFKEVSGTFTVKLPPEAFKYGTVRLHAAVFRLIKSVGSLTIDDAKLVKK